MTNSEPLTTKEHKARYNKLFGLPADACNCHHGSAQMCPHHTQADFDAARSTPEPGIDVEKTAQTFVAMGWNPLLAGAKAREFARLYLHARCPHCADRSTPEPGLREAAQEWADLCNDYDLNERGQAVMARLRAALANRAEEPR